ncbi:MAG: hypothetical protein C5B49_14760 [Bdellovibrio sp.]|nr:MAG: hypothetical protein C5B49_14760 [Bdellovibrio sp.]
MLKVPGCVRGGAATGVILVMLAMSVAHAADDESPWPSAPLQPEAALPSPQQPAAKKGRVKSPSPQPARLPPSQPRLSTGRHLFGSLLFSTANQVNYKGTANFLNSSFTATESTNMAFGLRGGYIWRQANSFGYSGDLTFEFVRKSNGIVGTLGSGTGVHGTYDGNGGQNLWTTQINLNYSFGSDFYAFLGPNYPLTFLIQGSEKLNGLIGYQLGLGYGFSDRISLEVSYRMIRMNGPIGGGALQIDEATLPGYILAVQYFF